MKKVGLGIGLGILLFFVFALLGCGSDPSLSSVQVIPAADTQSLSTAGETAQFAAIGTYTKSNKSTSTKDITNQVQWSSVDVAVATINSLGLATAGTVGGTTTITAKLGAVTGTSSLIVANPGNGGSLPSLAIYAAGDGKGTITSDPSGVNCTSGAGCTGRFPVGTVVILTAVPASGSTFGGWSSNCMALNPTSPTCLITMTNNAAVGAIFN